MRLLFLQKSNLTNLVWNLRSKIFLLRCAACFRYDEKKTLNKWCRMKNQRIVLVTGALSFISALYFLMGMYNSALPLSFNPRFSFFLASATAFVAVCAYQIYMSWNRVEIKYIRRKGETLARDLKKLKNFNDLVSFLKTKGKFDLGQKLETHVRDLERSALCEVNNENPSISAFNQGLKSSLQEVQASIAKLASSVKHIRSEEAAIEKFDKTLTNLLERVLQLEMESHRIGQKVATVDQYKRLEKKITLMASQLNRVEMGRNTIAPVGTVHEMTDQIECIEEVISEILSNFNLQGKLEQYQVKVTVEDSKLAISRNELYSRVNSLLETLLSQSESIKGEKLIKITSATSKEKYKLFNKVLLSNALDKDLIYRRTDKKNLYNAYNKDGKVVGRLLVDSFDLQSKEEIIRSTNRSFENSL